MLLAMIMMPMVLTRDLTLTLTLTLTCSVPVAMIMTPMVIHTLVVSGAKGLEIWSHRPG